MVLLLNRGIEPCNQHRSLHADPTARHINSVLKFVGDVYSWKETGLDFLYLNDLFVLVHVLCRELSNRGVDGANDGECPTSCPRQAAGFPPQFRVVYVAVVIVFSSWTCLRAPDSFLICCKWRCVDIADRCGSPFHLQSELDICGRSGVCWSIRGS